MELNEILFPVWKCSAGFYHSWESLRCMSGLELDVKPDQGYVANDILFEESKSRVSTDSSVDAIYGTHANFIQAIIDTIFQCLEGHSDKYELKNRVFVPVDRPIVLPTVHIPDKPMIVHY